MMWLLTWLNVSVATLNAMLQFLVIYRLGLLAVCGVNNPKVSPNSTHCFAVNL